LTDIPKKDIQPFLPADSGESIYYIKKTTHSNTAAHPFTARAHVEDWDQKLNALPPPSQVYAATSFFESAGNFKPSLGPREVRKLVRGNIQPQGNHASRRLVTTKRNPMESTETET
jgi:hypothetical protein